MSERMERMRADHLAVLTDALGPVELTQPQARIVRWLAGWDAPTVETVAEVLRKARGVAGTDTIFATRPGDIGHEVGSVQLAESYTQHRLVTRSTVEHGPAELVAHALAELACQAELVARITGKWGQWMTAADALAAGATVEQVGAAMGVHPDDVPVFMGSWAAQQRRHGFMTDAQYERVMELLAGVLPS